MGAFGKTFAEVKFSDLFPPPPFIKGEPKELLIKSPFEKGGFRGI